MNNFWAIILAAGASTRMKKQKLLLAFNGKTIIETVVDNAIQAVKSNIVVVLGSHHEEVRKQIGNPALHYVVNNNYQDGMLSSVICGFRALPESAEAVLIFLGDQPHVPPSIAGKLIDAKKQSTKGIIIPIFAGKRGHPILIDTKYISEIENLDPDQGLRSLISHNQTDILEIECDTPEILRDIDTPEDYQFEINKK
jgi:molybdenum cofactor cytidylyltransferase